MSRTNFDFSKIIGTPVKTSTQSQSHTLKKSSRFNPYSAPSDENIRRGITNVEGLIKTFYTNVSISMRDEIKELRVKLTQLYNEVSGEQKTEINNILFKLKNAKNLDEIEGELIRIEQVSDSISLNVSHSVQTLKYKNALLLIIIIYKLKELIIEPNIIDKLQSMRKTDKMTDKKYLEYLTGFFYKPQPYFRMLNIRDFYTFETRNEELNNSYIAYLALYSKFLFHYTTIINNIEIGDLNKYIDDTNRFIETHLKAKINRNHYKVYYAPLERSGGKSQSQSKRIKELCKANQIKLSRIIDGKRVAYKMKELITKLKRKKIMIP